MVHEGGGYPDEFEAVWRIYPKREGSNPKKRAHKAWLARIREGIDHQVLMDAVANYRVFCDQKGSTGSSFVMQAATFFGPDERWKDEYVVDELGEANRKLLRKRGKLEGMDLNEAYR